MVVSLELEKKPVSVTVFTEGTRGVPYLLTVKGRDGRIWYRRKVRSNKCNFNLPRHPKFINISVSHGKIASTLVGLLRPPKIPYLDKPDLRRPYSLSEVRLRKNYSIASPARMFKSLPFVEYNPTKMNRYWVPVQTFILLHEIGHQFFDNEEKADRWATIQFLNMGYNLSTAIYAMTRVMGKSAENTQRMLAQNELLKHLSKRYYA